MIVSEILKTCSHEKVAQAAVASIGRDFFERVNGAADEHGVRPGTFVAQAVRAFERRADESERHALERAIRNSDTPVLHGLRYILEDALENSRSPGCDDALAQD